MLRNVAVLMLVLPTVLLAQGPSKLQADRTRALDAAAKSPFFTKRGADAVKRVISGAASMKEDEKVADVPDPKATQPLLGAGQPAPGAATLPAAQPNGGPQTAPAETAFGWRLVGISYGKKQGMALFRADNKQISVLSGSELDSDTKVLSITKSRVVLWFHGKRLSLTPW